MGIFGRISRFFRPKKTPTRMGGTALGESKFRSIKRKTGTTTTSQQQTSSTPSSTSTSTSRSRGSSRRSYEAMTNTEKKEYLAEIEQTKQEGIETRGFSQSQIKAQVEEAQEKLKWTFKDYLSYLPGGKTPGEVIREKEVARLSTLHPEEMEYWQKEKLTRKPAKEFFIKPKEFIESKIERERYKAFSMGDRYVQEKGEKAIVKGAIMGATATVFPAVIPAIIAKETLMGTTETIFEKPFYEAGKKLDIRKAEERITAQERYYEGIGLSHLEKDIAAFNKKIEGQALSPEQYEKAVETQKELETRRKAFEGLEFDEKAYQKIEKEVSKEQKGTFWQEAGLQFTGKPQVREVAYTLAGLGIGIAGRAALVKVTVPKAEITGFTVDKKLMEIRGMDAKAIQKIESASMAQLKTWRELGVGKTTFKLFKKDYILQAKDIQTLAMKTPTGYDISLSKITHAKLIDPISEQVTKMDAEIFAIGKDQVSYALSHGKVVGVQDKITIGAEKIVSSKGIPVGKDYMFVKSHGIGRVQPFKITPAEQFVSTRSDIKIDSMIKALDKATRTESFFGAFQKTKPGLSVDIYGNDLGIISSGKGATISELTQIQEKALSNILAGTTKVVMPKVSTVVPATIATIAGISKPRPRTKPTTKPITATTLMAGLEEQQIQKQSMKQVAILESKVMQGILRSSALAAGQSQRMAGLTKQILSPVQVTKLKQIVEPRLPTIPAVRIPPTTLPPGWFIIPPFKMPKLYGYRIPKRRKRAKGKRKLTYMPGFTAKMLEIETRVTKLQLKKILRGVYTGLEVRPKLTVMK